MSQKHGRRTEDNRTWTGDLDAFKRGDDRKGYHLETREWNDSQRRWQEDATQADLNVIREKRTPDTQDKINSMVFLSYALIAALSALGFGLGFAIGWRLLG